MQKSAEAYGRMLARASLLMRVPPGAGEVTEDHNPSTSFNSTKLPEEIFVARELQERVGNRLQVGPSAATFTCPARELRWFSSASASTLQELAPYRDAVRGQLSGVQNSLRDLASGLTLGEDLTASGRHDLTNGFALASGADTEVLHLTTITHCSS